MQDFCLKKDVAVLSFGSRRFRMRIREALCAIEVNIEGPNPRPVLTRLMGLVDSIIVEYMKALSCVPVLCTADLFFVPLSKIQVVLDSDIKLDQPDGTPLLDRNKAVLLFGMWDEKQETSEEMSPCPMTGGESKADTNEDSSAPRPEFDIECLDPNGFEKGCAFGGSTMGFFIVDEAMDRSKVYAIKLFNKIVTASDIFREIEIMRCFCETHCRLLFSDNLCLQCLLFG